MNTWPTYLPRSSTSPRRPFTPDAVVTFLRVRREGASTYDVARHFFGSDATVHTNRARRWLTRFATDGLVYWDTADKKHRWYARGDV